MKEVEKQWEGERKKKLRKREKGRKGKDLMKKIVGIN